MTEYDKNIDGLLFAIADSQANNPYQKLPQNGKLP